MLYFGENTRRMKLKLPPRADGPAPKTAQDTRRMIIVGANGAGKTRFAARMAADAGEEAFSLSALRALYDKDTEDTTPGSIDSLYAALGGSGLFRPDIRGAFERLMALLLHEEMVALMKRKFADTQQPDARGTKLDRTIALWQEVFPDNRILVAEGRILIERRGAPGADARGRERGALLHRRAAVRAAGCGGVRRLAGDVHAPGVDVGAVEPPGAAAARLHLRVHHARPRLRGLAPGRGRGVGARLRPRAGHVELRRAAARHSARAGDIHGADRRTQAGALHRGRRGARATR